MKRASAAALPTDEEEDEGSDDALPTQNKKQKPEDAGGEDEVIYPRCFHFLLSLMIGRLPITSFSCRFTTALIFPLYPGSGERAGSLAGSCPASPPSRPDPQRICFAVSRNVGLY